MYRILMSELKNVSRETFPVRKALDSKKEIIHER